MLHLAGTDPESQRADTAMRGGVRIAAHDRRAGKREALFRADDVDDPLFGRDRVNIADAEGGRIALKRGELRGALRIVDGKAGPIGREPRSGRQIVIGHGQRQIGPANRAPGQSQRLEGLRARDLVDQMSVYIEKAGIVGIGAVGTRHDMGVPDLFVEGAGAAGHNDALCAARPAPAQDGNALMRDGITNVMER